MSRETTAEPGPKPSTDEAAKPRGSALHDYLKGVALILDFSGSLSRRRLPTGGYFTDADALAADWNAVGNDLRRAMGRHPHKP